MWDGRPGGREGVVVSGKGEEEREKMEGREGEVKRGYDRLS